MARIPRKHIIEDKSYFHVTWKCHNESFLLENKEAKSFLYKLLLTYKAKYKIKIHGYCFMNNHPHIIGYCESVELFSRFFQIVNGRLAKFINRELGRKGQVIMDRFKSPRIESERHMLHVLHYVDLNPVRAGICNRAKDYKWSSYRAHAFGEADPLLDPLPEGLKINHADYATQNEYFLTHGNIHIPIYQTTFFIGTPQWVKQRRRLLYNQLLRTKLTSHLTPGASL